MAATPNLGLELLEPQAFFNHEDWNEKLQVIDAAFEGLPLLRRIGEQDDLPTWDGEQWPGGGAPGLEELWAAMDPALDQFLGANHPLVADNYNKNKGETT